MQSPTSLLGHPLTGQFCNSSNSSNRFPKKRYYKQRILSRHGNHHSLWCNCRIKDIITYCFAENHNHIRTMLFLSYTHIQQACQSYHEIGTNRWDAEALQTGIAWRKSNIKHSLKHCQIKYAAKTIKFNSLLLYLAAEQLSELKSMNFHLSLRNQFKLYKRKRLTKEGSKISIA